LFSWPLAFISLCTHTSFFQLHHEYYTILANFSLVVTSLCHLSVTTVLFTVCKSYIVYGLSMFFNLYFVFMSYTVLVRPFICV
jgi:hypothetical protein